LVKRNIAVCFAENYRLPNNFRPFHLALPQIGFLLIGVNQRASGAALFLDSIEQKGNIWSR
jgi:hypothetical protein